MSHCQKTRAENIQHFGGRKTFNPPPKGCNHTLRMCHMRSNPAAISVSGKHSEFYLVSLSPGTFFILLVRREIKLAGPGNSLMSCVRAVKHLCCQTFMFQQLPATFSIVGSQIEKLRLTTLYQNKTAELYIKEHEETKSFTYTRRKVTGTYRSRRGYILYTHQNAYIMLPRYT